MPTPHPFATQARRTEPFLRNVMYVNVGSYALYMLQLEGEASLPKRFRAMRLDGRHCPGNRDTSEVAWIPLRTLKDSVFGTRRIAM